MKRYIFEDKAGEIYSGFMDEKGGVVVKKNETFLVPGFDILMKKPFGCHTNRMPDLKLIAIYHRTEIKLFLGEMSQVGRSFFNIPEER